ncbi:hypothetical protein RYX36_020933 [Vicia faba]
MNNLRNSQIYQPLWLISLDQPSHNNEEVAKERKNSQEDLKSTKENGPQNMDQDGKSDDAKQIKDTKGIRAFKFALAEFVKEILKPAWKISVLTERISKSMNRSKHDGDEAELIGEEGSSRHLRQRSEEAVQNESSQH